MPTCPHCSSSIDTVRKSVARGHIWNPPRIWACPECDKVLGVSQWA